MKTTAPLIIVGAGPAGLGCAIALQACGIQTRILDAREIATSFLAWPRQMHLLTPSFHGNAFGLADLNAVSPQTSPADFLHTQHPDGPAYARYLRALAAHYRLDIQAPVKVTGITPLKTGGFKLATDQGAEQAQFVIWAAGEFSHPDTGGIQGADHCLHNSRIRDWEEITQTKQKHVVIGGYESGVDAAIQLMHLGAEVHLLSRGEPWTLDDPDPSRSLSPHTRDRLREALLTAPGQVQFYQNADIVRVRPMGADYEVLDREGRSFHSPTKPILATGFRHALEPVRHLWDWQSGLPVFTEAADESTLTPGLFYSGPSLQHRGMLFCFIYKFRSRFGVIARAIAERLGQPWEQPLQLWKERGFMLEDLSCCSDCQCAVEAEEPIQPQIKDYAGTV